MQVTGLVGPPGSGKSHRALLVAFENSIPLIIDDGLLIKNNNIIAGTSSKRQKTKIGAIKTAIFNDDEHAREVGGKIREIDPEKILILGTSKEMINRIIGRLDLPEPSRYIFIDEIASKEEIETAKNIRTKFDKHVIPAPTVEVKSRFSGLLIDPLPTFFRRKAAEPRQRRFMVDQTVVQPTFNFLGKFLITSAALNQIITASVSDIPGLDNIRHIRTYTTPEGIKINFEISVFHGYNIPKIAESCQQNIERHLRHMTSLHILEININVKKLVIKTD
ncbi:MAG: Asp23/Gls24 family envelope stress response protein [Clostridia bacterium]|nr:Asp23/Gls24 family envelope stress response protein [Clostridia bacterium]